MDFSAQQRANRYLNEFILKGDRNSIPNLSEQDIATMKIEKMATYADYVTKSMHLKESSEMWDLFCENQLDTVYDSELKELYSVAFEMGPAGICNYAYATLHCPAYLRKDYKKVLDAVLDKVKERILKSTRSWKVKQFGKDLAVIVFFVYVLYTVLYPKYYF